jgi:outer membrane protein assembly factor BamD
MLRRGLISVSLAVLLAATISCTNKKVQNPLSNVGSKQPDKVLFDRAMDALKHNHYDVARITLQTLINTYPDSEYIARAKLAVGDSWYAEGGTAALTQAEIEYKDFITFFPNMPEAAEAQLKIANIHFAEMEKPDRDFTHAQRAEEEYRQLILQFPDSKLVPEAKEKLREVQEVLAEREFRIGRFYYLRRSLPAAIARLQSLADQYPLYSGVDEALYMLGDCYEMEIQNVRSQPQLPEAMKGKLIKEFTDNAANSYSRILTRYPVMGRAEDAKRRLEALHRPVPKATPEALAQNKAEEESREETSRFGRIKESFHKSPDVSEAARVGEPTLVDPKPVSATQVLQEATNTMRSALSPGSENNKASVDIVKDGTPGPNQPTPRSDAPANATDPSTSTTGTQAATNAAPAAGNSGVASSDSSSNTAGIEELKPNTAAAPAQGAAQNSDGSSGSDAQSESSQPAPAPAQVNEAASGSASTTASSGSADQPTQASNDSTSKKKKKKGLGKLNPF